MTDEEREALIEAQAKEERAKKSPTPKSAKLAKNVPVVDSETEAAPAPVKVEYPADLTQWTPDNFRTARKNRNARLVQAVRQLGQGNQLNPDPQANAQLLAELLRPLSAAKGPRASEESELAEGAAGGALPGLAAAIVDALGINGSTEARGVLKLILMGKQPSDDADRTLILAALRTIAAHPDDENQRILLAVLTVPDSIRPPGRGQVTADQLHEECIRQVRSIANADFRLRLAQRAKQGVSSATSHRRLMAMLTAPEVANVGAQAELLASGQVDPTMLPAVDRQLGQASQQVLDRLLRTAAAEWATASPAPAATASTPSRGVDDELVSVPHDSSFNDIVQIAQQLWRPDVSTTVAARVSASDNLQKDIAVSTLAASLPSDTVRKAFAQRWEKLWVDEAGVTESSSLLSNGARDPGLLIVLKQLPREAPKREAAAAKAAAKIAKPVSDNPQSQRTAKEQTARQVWLRISENYVRSLADRLGKAADNPSRGAGVAVNQALDPVDSTDEFDKLLDSSSQGNAPTARASASPESAAGIAEIGVTLPEEARVKASYRLNWPADFNGRLEGAEASPLIVNYVRLETDAEVSSLIRFYDRQLKSAFVRTMGNDRWIDSLTKLDDGQVRSIDILISRADGGSATGHGKEKLKIVVLSVEVPDPQQRSKPEEADPTALAPAGN